jgi:hypothetical protein
MTNTVLIKRSSTPGAVPVAGDLQSGELALNYADGNLFYKNASGNVTVIASSANLSVTGNITAANFIGNANIQYTASTAPATGNLIGAQWYNTSTDTLYEWQTDGTSNYWVDITGPVIGSNGAVAGTTLVNGTSNVSVGLNGNVTLSVGGVPNVAVFASTGSTITGNLSATGNLDLAGNININSDMFLLHAPSGSGQVVFSDGGVDSGGLLSVGTSLSSYAGGGSLNLVTTATLAGNIGVFVAESETARFTTTGVAVTGIISATGNIISSGNISGDYLRASGNAIVTYAPLTAIGAGITINTGNTQGGTGFADFLKATNTTTGATNPNKFFRLNSTGGLEVINSAYTATLLSLTDAGALSVSSTVSGTGFNVNNKQAVNGPAFSASANASTTIPTDVLTKVNFQAEEYDTNNNYASSTFTPTVEGYYQLNSTVRMSGASGTGEMMIVLYKNGAEYHRGWNSQGVQIGSGWWSMSVSSTAYANGTGDYFEIYVQQGSAANRDTTSGPTITWFNGCMLRGA